MLKRALVIVWVLFAFLPGRSQVVYEDVANTGIYEFLDELANHRIIDLNSAVKPYARTLIAEKLQQAYNLHRERESRKDKGCLDQRQWKELLFYLQDYQLDLPKASWPGVTGKKPEGTTGPARMAEHFDYKLGFLFPRQENMVLALNPAGYLYKDSLFTFSARPVLGLRSWANANGSGYHRWWGGSMFGYIGEHVGFYATLTDNNATEPLAEPEYFNQEQGAVWKTGSQGGIDFSEMRGGMTASVKWGSLGLMNDRIMWGDHYHGSNILSGKAPAFPYVQLHLNPARWFDFNYIHGWLNSGIVDSTRSHMDGDIYREVYYNKYIAANLFTFIPWRGLNISFGNSIIYSDVGVQPLYLIPFLFYNAVDAVRTGYVDYAGSNSQLFFNISSRNVRHLHLYVSFFVDEWKTKRLTDPELSNFTSLKTGFRLDGFPVANLALTGEYTRTMPMTYDHYISTTTFRSNDYCLGHYLRENSQEFYIGLDYKPLRGLLISASWTLAQHGTDVPYRVDAGYNVAAVPFLSPVTWENNEVALSARYEYTSGGFFFARYVFSSRTGEDQNPYEPAEMRGRTNNFQAGINLGF